MPDSEAKRKWDKENTRNIVIKLNKNTDPDILSYLDELTVSYSSIVKQALREYIAHHAKD